jgi:predicted transcriptional regulator
MRYRTRTRTRTEIMTQILRIANGVGSTKTKLMYKAFLSYARMQHYLMVLTQNDLLSYDLASRTFKTTKKGLRFIEVYNQIDGIIKAAAEEQQL